MKALVLIGLGLACACSLALAQERPKTPAGGRTPPTDVNANLPFTRLRVSGHVSVGESAPDFALTSSTGREVVLSRLRGDWVLLCFAAGRAEFAGLDSMAADLVEMGVRMIGICKDKPQTLRPFVQREGIPFEILADMTGEVSEIYGLYDSGTSLAQPGFVVVDRAGIVRLALQGAAPADQIVGLTRYTMTGFPARP